MGAIMSYNFKDYLKITEAAKFLGVTTNTVRNWEKSGKIKLYKSSISSYRFYKKEDLEEILSSIVLVK